MNEPRKCLLIGSITPDMFPKLRKAFDTIYSATIKHNVVSIGKHQVTECPKGEESFHVAILIGASMETVTRDLGSEWGRQVEEMKRFLDKVDANAKSPQPLMILSPEGKVEEDLFQSRCDVADKEIKSHLENYVDFAPWVRTPCEREAIQREVYIAESKGKGSVEIETRTVIFKALFKLGTAELDDCQVEPTIECLRGRIADEKLDAYDFGSLLITEMDGWEYTTPGTEYTKTLYIENEDEGEPTLRYNFHVNFKDNNSIEVTDVHCLNHKTGIEV